MKRRLFVVVYDENIDGFVSGAKVTFIPKPGQGCTNLVATTDKDGRASFVLLTCERWGITIEHPDYEKFTTLPDYPIWASLWDDDECWIWVNRATPYRGKADLTDLTVDKNSVMPGDTLTVTGYLKATEADATFMIYLIVSERYSTIGDAQSPSTPLAVGQTMQFSHTFTIPTDTVVDELNKINVKAIGFHLE